MADAIHRHHRNHGSDGGRGKLDALRGRNKIKFYRLERGRTTAGRRALYVAIQGFGWFGKNSAYRRSIRPGNDHSSCRPTISACFDSARDINGDGYADFIDAAYDNSPTTSSALVYFGHPDVHSIAFATPDITLQLPRTIFGSAAFPERVLADVITTGDFNDDGFGDIAVAGVSSSATNGISILLGSNSLSPNLNLMADADVFVALTGVAGDLRAASVGDLNADGADDLAIGNRSTSMFVLLGKPAAAADGWKSWKSAPPILVADFSDGLQPSMDGFTLVNEAASGYLDVATPTIGTGEQNLWNVTTRRGSEGQHSSPHSLYFGNSETGEYRTIIAGVPSRVLGRAVTDLDLTHVPVGGKVQLSFRYLLSTEGAPSDFDQARVKLSTNQFAGVNDHIILASNNSIEASSNSFPGQTLFESGSGGGGGVGSHWQSMTIDLTSFAGQQVQLAFEFDSIDEYVNDREGFYVDDVLVRVERIELNSSNLVTITGAVSDNLASSISTIGDLTGDGIPEFVVLENTPANFEVFNPNQLSETGTFMSSMVLAHGSLDSLMI